MDKEYSRQYFNEKAYSWDQTLRSNTPQQLVALIERLDIFPDTRVLDVGSGTGVFVPLIQRKVGKNGRVVCVDFAFNMLSIARSKNGHHAITYVCAEIETAGFHSEAFNAAVCYSAFPHFHDKPLVLRNVYHLLKPGGSVFICHSASREFINNIHLNIPDFEDHLLPKREQMLVLLRDAGFGQIKIEEEPDFYIASGKK